MKTLIVITLSLAALSVVVVRTMPPAVTTEVAILHDITEKHLAQPHAGEILKLLNVTADTKWNGATLRLTDLSDVSLGFVSQASIASANPWLSNEPDRDKEITKFKAEVTSIIASSESEQTGRKYSSIYLPIARTLNLLSQSKAQNKILLVYSDLMENTPELSLYSKTEFNLLKSNPDAVRKVLEMQERLKSLHGIQVYLIYQPKDAQGDEDYKTVSGFYKTMLEDHGAMVSIEANITN